MYNCQRQTKQRGKDPCFRELGMAVATIHVRTVAIMAFTAMITEKAQIHHGPSCSSHSHQHRTACGSRWHPSGRGRASAGAGKQIRWGSHPGASFRDMPRCLANLVGQRTDRVGYQKGEHPSSQRDDVWQTSRVQIRACWRKAGKCINPCEAMREPCTPEPVTALTCADPMLGLHLTPNPSTLIPGRLALQR